MPTSEAAIASPTPAQAPIVDSKLLKWVVIVGCAVPGLLLIWDAYRNQLGVNDINFAIRSTGMLGLVFMTLSLVITPIRRLTGWNAIVGVRRRAQRKDQRQRHQQPHGKSSPPRSTP